MTDKALLTCPECDFTSSKEKRLVKHLRKVHGKAAIKCPWCVYVHYSGSVASLCVHKKHDHRSVRLRCFLCAFTSRSLSKWASHVNLSHSGQTSSLVILTGFPADLRSKNAGSRIQDLFFKTATDRNLGSDGGLQAHCDKEGQASSEASAQGTHLELSSENDVLVQTRGTIPDQKISDSVTASGESSRFSCTFCAYTTSKCKKLRKHVEQDHSDSTATDFCGSDSGKHIEQDHSDSTATDFCVKESDSGKHVEQDHSDSTPTDFCVEGSDSGKHVEQDHSDSTFTDICVEGSDSGKHLKLEYLDSTSKDFSVEDSDTTKSTEKSCFKCPYCENSFSTVRLLGNHCRSQHLQGSHYRCPQCAFQVKAVSSLLSHLRCHTGERPFACHLCSYKAEQYDHLIRHLNQHQDIRPYKCSQCDYRAKRKDHLIQHKKIHSNERPFKCSFCDYRAKFTRQLKEHTRTHTNERPYQCSMCDYAAKSASALQKHIRVHTKEKPYKCDFCMRYFSQNSSCKKHMRTLNCFWV
ncbi:Zinc finger protein 569 [Plakobranchus ocellatus]|uniref:Zinc finger protein 569 n=1 Tax=Plakobranchus ocellatus TaxID=259542 RepID=A0AAV4C510_9GAST|nr:Zinc finger protein 569 [Plakobranchus ocellatus]